MSTIRPGAPGKNKAFLVLILSIFLLLILAVPPVMQGLFIISGRASQVISGLFNIGGGPSWLYAGQSASQVAKGSPVLLFAYWSGNSSLDYAWIATNETGVWEDKAVYGSPLKMSGFSGWSNFTWSNPSFSGNVYWRICANDSSGSMNCTNIMSFNVIAPAPGGTPEGGVTGGGGAAAPPVSAADFSIDSEFLRISAKQGETTAGYVKINNTGNVALSFNLTVDIFVKSAILSDYSFVLLPGESKSITVAFIPKEDILPDIYTGSLVIKAGSTTKSVMLLMEVKPRKSLFDIYVSLPETPLEAVRGQEVEANIFLYNFGETKPMDISFYYSVRDFSGRDLIYNRENISVEEQKVVNRRITIPQDMEPGFYLFYARVEYSNQTAASGGLIKVVERESGIENPPSIGYWVIIILPIAVLAVVLALIFWKKALGRRRGRELLDLR